MLSGIAVYRSIVLVLDPRRLKANPDMSALFLKCLREKFQISFSGSTVKFPETITFIIAFAVHYLITPSAQ
jgi:hypothetical protein